MTTTSDSDQTVTSHDVPKKEGLIEWIGQVDIAATNERFIAREKFKLKKDGGIFVFMDDNFFPRWFLQGDGKIEDPIPASTLRYGKLLKTATDQPQEAGKVAIISELGGEAQAETSLSEMWGLAAKQSLGENGVLILDGSPNVFYVPDQNGVIRAITIYWLFGQDLVVYASPTRYPFGWQAGDQVFSRKNR